MITLTLLAAPQRTPLQQWCFENSSVIRIGRAVDNEVVLNDSLVSRYHLELRQVSDSWCLISHGTNGTFLNGKLVIQSQLPNNSLLQLAKGGPILQFQIQGVKVPASSACSHEGNTSGNLFCVHCGQPLNVKKIIRDYQVLKTLGQGGMGTTYLAWDAAGSLGGHPQLLVIKQMNADMAKIAKAQELFQREANTLQRLNHPGIPKFYDFFEEGSIKYLLMEYIQGEDLEERIHKTGPVTPRQAIAWMMETCDILYYLHSQFPPLIHRDIKPANLMVRSSNNRIVVLDFGAVKEIDTEPGTRIGAEGYWAPEQQRGEPLTQSDLYAIGPTLIFLLTSREPSRFGNSHFDIKGIPTITTQLRDVINRVTEYRPRDRYQTAQELAVALAACQ